MNKEKVLNEEQDKKNNVKVKIIGKTITIIGIITLIFGIILLIAGSIENENVDLCKIGFLLDIVGFLLFSVGLITMLIAPCRELTTDVIKHVTPAVKEEINKNPLTIDNIFRKITKKIIENKKVSLCFVISIIVFVISKNVFLFYVTILLCSIFYEISSLLISKIQKSTQNFKDSSIPKNDTLKCEKFGKVLKTTDKFCPSCGTQLNAESKVVKKLVKPSDFDPLFNKTEDLMLEDFINKELVKANIDKNNSMIPMAILKRKKILNIIFAVLLFNYISLIFFHFPLYTYIIGILILVIFFRSTRKYTLMKYLKKEIKSRPSEKISNIVMNAKNSFVSDDSKTSNIICILIGCILPLIIFINPRIMYERVNNGYAVRFYIFGITNFETVEIPETYKGEKVVSLRGNTFSNMPFLKSVSLPNTITEIRGQAFKNDSSLISVNIPNKLEYLGGGAFYKCSSIKKITLPDTLIYMGGETFYGASSLKYIKLSNNLTEIRGDSFELCKSLENITIPDKVTRIGGHAFYDDSSLKKVKFTENSELSEIGSSAFRLCPRLKSIILPNNNISINERAFKESPTVVKHFGDVNYGYLVDSSKYNYYESIIIEKGESNEIAKYYSESIEKNSVITLLNIDYIDGKSNFNMKYSNGIDEVNFILNGDNPVKKINDNLEVEISNSYVLNNNDYISIKAYYN